MTIKIITINLPTQYLDAIQVLQDLGLYPSRSEAIRTALRNFLSDELTFDQELQPEQFKMIVRSVKE